MFRVFFQKKQKKKRKCSGFLLKKYRNRKEIEDTFFKNAEKEKKI